MSAPSQARANACDRPRPRAPPVMTATFPAIEFAIERPSVPDSIIRYTDFLVNTMYCDSYHGTPVFVTGAARMMLTP
jgi:hypothetical protein